MKDTALLLCDLQNDFLSPGGAYHRAGVVTPDLAAVPARVAPLVPYVRARGGWIISTHFTMVPFKDGEPYISPHLRQVRPFLKRGDFLPGGWGHALVDGLGPADAAVEKVAFSAFYQSRLEWVLARTGVKRLLVCGIVTNGGVTSTARDAHVRDYEVTVLEDGCAAGTAALHDTAIAALRPIAAISTVAQVIAGAAPS